MKLQGNRQAACRFTSLPSAPSAPFDPGSPQQPEHLTVSAALRSSSCDEVYLSMLFSTWHVEKLKFDYIVWQKTRQMLPGWVLSCDAMITGTTHVWFIIKKGMMLFALRDCTCSDWKKIHRVQPAGGIAVQLYILTGYKSFNSTWFIGINAIKTILHDCIIVCCIICLHSGRSCTVKFMLKHIWVIYISHYPYLQWVGMLNVAKVGCVTASFFLFSFFS